MTAAPGADRASHASSRTRRAILAAAARVLARDRTATLAAVAAAAEVSRTTLHRHFPDRDALLNAAIEHSLLTVGQSTADAALDQGPPGAALRRLVAAMVSVGDHLTFLFADPQLLQNYGGADVAAPTPADDPVLLLIERGQADGVFDPEVPPSWIQHVLWALVYTGCEEADAGRVPRHGVPETVIRTLEHGVLRDGGHR